jgi:tetrapyrrole methylase family protein/MazG family protein
MTDPEQHAPPHRDPGGMPMPRLLEIMRILRGPGGCPWDHQQTLQTLKEHLVEESHEVLDAIDSGNRSQLRDELGDLLLQIVFQSQICAEEGAFTFDDVAQTIGDKLIRRHPHVFGNTRADSPDQVLRNWEAIKKAERGDKPRSMLDGIPRSLPALRRAHLVQKRVARVGFDWDHVDGALAKLEEEVAELRAAASSGEPAAIREEIGDVLFAAVNVSRFLDQNAEEILDQTIQKFARRFEALEARVHASGRKVSDVPLAELDQIWEEVKASESRGDAARGDSS